MQAIEQKFIQAATFHRQGQLDKAEAIYLDILKINPRHYNVLHLLGVVNYQTGRYQQAVELINKAIKINPNDASFYSNLGISLIELNEVEFAIEAYKKAIKLNPNNADFYCNIGNALSKIAKFEDAVKNYDEAIKINSRNPNYFYNKGNALRESKRGEEAVISYNKAIFLDPNNSLYYANLGSVLFEMGEIKSAIINYEKAILLDPKSASNYMNFGNVLSKIKDNDAALQSYNKAIALNPKFADIYYNRAVFFEDLKKFELALIDYKKTLELDPNFKFLLGKIFSTKIKLCDWSNYKEDLAKIKDGICLKKLVTEPFLLLAAKDSLNLNLEVAKAYVNSDFPEDKSFFPFKKCSSSKKIKLAYYSADFHSHATSYLMAGLFELHDRSRFELIAFSFGPESNDEMRRRVEKSFDRFIDVRLKSDNEIVKISREMGVDIAVDLKGFTKDMRLGIFAKRVAPIQVNYLGYPGTMAAGYIDYIIADKVLIPDEQRRKYYLEKVVYLPNSYQVNDSKREISSKVYRKRDFSLPEESFIFCCFNNNYKITPQVFDVWMNILKRVSNSVLWLLEDNSIAADNLRREAVKRGVDESRLVFAKRMQLSEHLARHKLADLFLDTIPYNAHTTCSDALWASLPVLTIAGESFASRVSASLLTAVGIEEMIVDNFVDYEERAVEFATNREKLQLVKEKLQKNRLTMPLFDTKLFTSNLEKAYKTMYDKYQNNLEFDDIKIGEYPFA